MSLCYEDCQLCNSLYVPKVKSSAHVCRECDYEKLLHDKNHYPRDLSDDDVQNILNYYAGQRMLNKLSK